MDGLFSVQQEITTRFKKRIFTGRGFHLPEVGVYYPSVLAHSCLKEQWNYYELAIREGKLLDDAILRIGEGLVWHDLIQSWNIWDATEVRARQRVKLGKGKFLHIHGRADALRGDTVYEFKRTASVPWNWKPRFEHALQLSWYMDVLGKPKGKFVYIGYDSARQFTIKEIAWSPSEWHATQIVNRAITLHDYLVSGNPPLCSCRNRYHDIAWERYLEEKGKKRR